MDVEEEEDANSCLNHHYPVDDAAQGAWYVSCVEQAYFVEESVKEADVGLRHHVVIGMQYIHILSVYSTEQLCSAYCY